MSLTTVPIGKLPNRKIRGLNPEQSFLYDRALFGLGSYTQEEVRTMHPDKKKRIIKVHKRAQTILNLWKQRIIIELSNHIFSTLFPDSPITKELVQEHSSTDENYNNKMNFKDLRITKKDIIWYFIVEGILPKNFNQLKSTEEISKVYSKQKPERKTEVVEIL